MNKKQADLKARAKYREWKETNQGYTFNDYLEMLEYERKHPW